MRPNRPDNQKEHIPHECRNAQNRLLAYLDEGLDPIAQTQMQAHLDSCERCRTELAQYRRAESALASAVFMAPPVGDLRADFYARLAASKRPQAGQRGANIWRVAVPACAAGLLWLIWRPGLPADRTQKPVSVVVNRPPLMKKLESISPVPALKNFVVAQKFVPAFSRKPKEKFTAPQKRLEIARVPATAAGKHGFAFNSPAVPGKETTSALRPEPFGLMTGRNKPRAYARGLSVLASAKKLPQVVELYSYKLAMSSHFAEQEVLAEAARQSKDASLFDTSLSAESKEEKVPERLAFRQGQLGRVAPLSVQIVLKKAEAVSAMEDTVDLEVRDETRGFASSTRVAGSIEQQESGEVLTIEAESENGS